MSKNPTASLVPRWQASIDDHVVALGWSRDGGLLAAAGVGGPVTVYAAAGESRQQLPGHGFGTMALDWGGDHGRLLATAGQDGVAKLWDVSAANHVCRVLQGGAAWVGHVGFDPSGTLLATAAGKKLRLWDCSGRLLRDYPNHSSTISDIQWRPQGGELVASSYGCLSLWGPDSLEPKRRYEWKGSILKVAWSPDGHYVATGDQDATVHFWNAQAGTDLMMSGYPTKVRELAWSPDSKLLATGGGDVPCVWNCSGDGPEGTEPYLLDAHAARVTALTYQRRGPLLASAGADGLIALWRPERGQQPLAEHRMAAPIAQLTWSPDDQLLAAGTEAGDVVVLTVA